MKQQQQLKAREMYCQTNSSKTEIAGKLGVSRRTIYQWSIEGDWEKLRMSARCMPSMLAEKCYYLIGHFTDHLLSKDSFQQSVTKADVDILFKLTKTVNLLKKGSTINENMETFTHFLEAVKSKDADLADAVIPHIDTFITAKLADSTFNVLDGFSPQGTKPFPEKEIMEKWQDEKDAEALAKEGWTPASQTTDQPQTQAAQTVPQSYPSNVASSQPKEQQTPPADHQHANKPKQSPGNNAKLSRITYHKNRQKLKTHTANTAA